MRYDIRLYVIPAYQVLTWLLTRGEQKTTESMMT